MVYIVFPVAVPGILSAGIFAFTLSWNEFIYALVFLSSPAQKTVPVGVTSELIRGDVFYWGPLMAGALLGSIPGGVFYFFFVEPYFAGVRGPGEGCGGGARPPPQLYTAGRWSTRGEGREPRDPRQGFRGSGGPFGLRQDYNLADGGGTRIHHIRRCFDRRYGGEQSAAHGSRHRHGIPELRALPAHDRLRQHGFRPEDAQIRAHRDRYARAGGGRDPRNPEFAEANTAAAVRRTAPARRPRPGHCAPSAGVFVRRAALQSRRETPRPDAGRAQEAAHTAQHDGDLRDPRPGGGDDAWRSRGGDAGRSRAAGGRAARALQRAGQSLCRRLSRLACHEFRRCPSEWRERRPAGAQARLRH